MSKIFRLHSGASENIEHWQEISSHLSDNYINSIEDPAGSSASTQITSIPSPFARMDLVRTAFRYVNSHREMDGKTIYHKIISDCLDVGEIFFNSEAFKDKIELLEWKSGITMNGGSLAIDPTSDLGLLLHSSNPKHKLLGETLKMYLFQDNTAFNFAKLQNIYLLNYKHGPELINIIGGTSPATLFFSSANDLSFVDITFGNDRVFDGSYCPLLKRSRDFIKYFYAFARSFPRFSEVFAEINTYMELTFQELDESLKGTIRELENDFYTNSYNVIPVKAEGNNAEILGLNLRAKNYGGGHDTDDYDFRIDTTKVINGLTPLVLPNDPFNEPLKYAGGIWQSHYHTKVPKYDERPLEERTLPNQTHIKYPYLTVSDLLEPYIIRLPYPIDSDKFFDGNYEIKGEKDHGYTLPLKKKFFEYFSIKDLQGIVGDGKKRFELTGMAGGVKATLRIPIKKNKYIQLTRVYYANQFQDKIQQADEKENIGVIMENQYTVVIYPFAKISQEINPHYRILLVDRDVSSLTKYYNYNIQLYTELNPTQALTATAKKTRSRKDQAQGVTTEYTILEHEFDFVEVSHNDAKGILVPLFKNLHTPSKIFKFAIDFGTTNTHIEYKMGTEDAKALNITEKEVQLGTLYMPGEKTEAYLDNPRLGFGAVKLLDAIKSEFLPFQVGGGQYKFPQRTVIHDTGRFNADESNFALADFNIPFWYLKENRQNDTEITSNLKWADFRQDNKLESRTKGFLKQLFIMIRNKVLLNNGDLAKTEIVWFYPNSMPLYRRNFMQKAWEAYFTRYISLSGKIGSMSESLAPFHYFREKGGIIALNKPVACVDIGGGTTDVVIYSNNEPSILTSFKFASNSLFGDGYANTSGSNGFVLKYETKIREILTKNELTELDTIFNKIKTSSSKSIELIEFFFALENNEKVKDKKISLSFTKMLTEDTDLKIVFLFYYSAIIYHIAKLLKISNLETPRFITFSGNGSKIISTIAGSSNLSNLAAFTKIIFAEVFDLSTLPNIELKVYPNSKEITCKGGLECTDISKYNGVEENIKKVLVGDEANTLVPETHLTYNQLKDTKLLNSVCKEVTAFIEMFFLWNEKLNYYNYFGINPAKFDLYKDILTEDCKTFLLAGIEEKMKDAQENVKIDVEEPLFFYPLIGAINKLAYKIETNSHE